MVILAVIAASFGPYTPLPGVRTEQLAVYGVFAVGLLRAQWMRVRLAATALALAVLLLFQVLLILVGAVAPTSGVPAFGPGNVMAGLDNAVLPLAALAAVHMFVDIRDARPLLRKVCRMIVCVACANALLAVWSIDHDLSPLLATFWDNDATRQSVSERAVQLGRYSGIFNQPAEAGEFYGLALIAAVYRYRDEAWKLATTCALVTVGGLLTVSKVFILVGLPVGAWQLLRTCRRRPAQVATLAAVVMAIAVSSAAGLVPRWKGSEYLLRLLRPSDSDGGYLDLYTAGRFGDHSTLQAVVSELLGSSPWFGFGAGGVAVAYDNGWVEALAVGGLVGAATYTAILAVLAIAWTMRRAHENDAWLSRFQGGLVLIMIGASVGLPALTANRVATIVWILVGLLSLAELAASTCDSTSSHARTSASEVT